MYHHHSQQQGFSNGSRSALHQPPQIQNPNPSNMQPMRYQFPRPTQLPDELESALAIRTARDVDLRQLNQHHHQGAGADTSQHGNYGSNQGPHSSDHLPGLQQNMQWSDYQAPDMPLGAMPPNVNTHSNQHLGLNERPNSNQAGVQVANRVAPVRDLNLSQPPRLQIGRQGQNFYTPESAGSILASFGLSNEDLEVLSHYPDDQLTPDTLPFILRDIQINKSGNQNPGPSTQSTFSRGIHDSSLLSSTFPPLSQSSEVPSLLTVTQTPGKVIDYGHASRAKDEPKTGETFKREQLSSESAVKMYPVSSNSNKKKPEMHPSSLEPSQPRKIEDKDYRNRTSIVKHDKDFRPPRKSPQPTKDYRPSSESRYKTSSKSSRPSSSSSKPQSEGKKWPRPTMISDFAGISPKVYPHTCSVCNIKCDQEKDWLTHVNTVVHTACSKGLRNKYPDWKPNLPSHKVQYGSRTPWSTKEKSSSHSVDKSRSRSPASSPPRSRCRADTHSTRVQSRHYPLQSRHSSDRHSSEHHHSSSHTSKPSRPSSSSRERRPASSDSSAHGVWRGVKRLPDERNVSSSTDGSKHGQPQSHSKPIKGVTKSGAKTSNVFTKSPPAKKKKIAAPVAKVAPAPQCLVYLTGIPNDASEQEVINLVGSFGKINNVILLPCAEEDNESDNGQKASVCMMKVEDAQALVTATNLCIREQPITASVAKKNEAGKSPIANDSLPASGNDKKTPGNNSEREAEQKVHTEKGTLLLTGLPESGWCENDIVSLVQPFWTPSDIIMATQIGKVLVSVPDKEAAANMLKDHSSTPAKVKDSEIKLVILKQCIDCSTPVALFNVLMESEDPQQSTVAVSWNRLLVISNVPDAHSGYREVQKLIERFGTVIKTLVIKNMVICEMATAAMALSVYKRFQTFPCIIQSNPLMFSRKADPKANTATKVTSTGPDSSQTKTANVKVSQPVNEEKSKSQPQKLDNSQNKNKKMKISQKKVKEEVLKDGNSNKSKRLKMTIEGSSSVLLSDVSDTSDDLEADVVFKTTAEDVSASVGVKSETSTIKVSEPPIVDGDSASKTSSSDQLPQVTQAINTPVVEGVTETMSHSNSSDLSALSAGYLVEVTPDTKTSTNTETLAVEETRSEGAEKDAKKFNTEKQECHTRKDKEEERDKERVRLDRERRAREREREERARRENERRERERRQRKRGYHDGSGLSSKSDSRQSSRRDKQDGNKSDTKMDQEDEFLFNLSDFVTVDEVGEVPDPSDSSTVPMETTMEDADASTLIQQTTEEDTTMESTTTLVKVDEHEPDVDHANTLTSETSDALVSSEVVNTAASPQTQTELNESQPQVSMCPEAEDCEPTGEPDSAQAVDVVSTPEDQPLPEPVASDENPFNCSTAAGEDTAKMEQDSKEINPPTACETKEEEKIKVMELKSLDEPNKNLKDTNAEAGEYQTCENPAPTTQEVCEKTEVQTKLSKRADLPPYDPNNPVGMEYLLPKTGFFCKVCNRFFSGAKEAEFNHCKTLKHYENLQEHLKKTGSVKSKTNSI
ncbi:zinc finger protein 638-like isoform X3 [Gouania willdenowi]|uniref:zinc finger protein 638-like isoform X3 n=1 Tax=Gouania willdenowi TaxID=441366 RepID=UPI0010566302|nr:zinc finger protein 638-like isoform X3 [Gouania willdenowi]